MFIKWFSASALFLYVLYVITLNFYIDPTANSFLSEKVNLTRELDTGIWLVVLKVHVAAACTALLAGGFALSVAKASKLRPYHKIAGYLYVLCVLAVIVTSGYMAPFSTGGKINSIAFNLMNMLWFAFTLAAVIAILRKSVKKHRMWMIRSYVFCSTNLVIHLIAAALHRLAGVDYVTGYTFGVYGALIFNLALPVFIRLYSAGKVERLKGLGS
ncbi:DUF2306 domain-containing protein [Paenibacillus thermotolerans]|uniref:DUF2306 domain-containing protein n=1 Tax=Paenibacillus thermotolerans TaxID=3027807 RepID=UPI0023689200|nr:MULTISPECIES: DUF2306 domain-containing protein [unclassified Paenibacillus]